MITKIDDNFVYIPTNNKVIRSVREYICYSIVDSVHNSIWTLVYRSVIDSIGDSVWRSIRQSIETNVKKEAKK